MNEQRTKILTGIKEHLEGRGIEVDSLSPETRIVDDLDLDSLDTVEMTLGLEKRFGVEIPDEEAEQLGTIGDVVTLIDGKLTSVTT